MTQAEQLATLLERTENILDKVGSIEVHLHELNGKVNDTCLKLAKTEEIAKSAAEQGEKNKKRLDSLMIPLLLSVVAAVVGISAAVIQGM